MEQEGREALLFCFCSQPSAPNERRRTDSRGRPSDTMIVFDKPVRGLSQAALSRFLSRARPTTGLRGPVNVWVTSSGKLRGLNRQFRNKDEPTDVLSFPRLDESAEFAGDIAISADIARQNARLLGHTLAEEIKILALHGLLHLAGYDHERDGGRMAREECRLRRAFALPAALLERSGAPPRLRVRKRSPESAARTNPRSRRAVR